METEGVKHSSGMISAALYRLVALAGFVAVFITSDPKIAGSILAIAMLLYSVHQLVIGAERREIPRNESEIDFPTHARSSEYQRLHHDLNHAYLQQEQASSQENYRSKQAA